MLRLGRRGTLVGGGEAAVDFLTRCPECILQFSLAKMSRFIQRLRSWSLAPPQSRNVSQFQDSVVGWGGFEFNVRVPSLLEKLLLLVLIGLAISEDLGG